MIVKSLELKNFRNYEKASIELSEGVNILYGENAQGKTNLLESVYVGATGHSHRTGKDKDMIRFGEEEAHIKFFTEKRGVTDRIDVHLKKNRAKGIAVNGVPLKRTADLSGITNVVFFSPEDLDIIKNGPAARRKFMDMELCQLDKIYARQLSSYNKVLTQRNRLLKDMDSHYGYIDTLDTWDEQLIKYGTEVIIRRRQFTEELESVIQDIHGNITGGKENIFLNYEPDISEDDFEKKLKSGRSKDMAARVTLTGPHRDDMQIRVGNMDIRTYGSQGQQRTAALSLKMSEINLIRKKTGDSPVLLLDDVLSELDRGRQEKLLDSLDSVQTMMTCTGVDEFVKERFPVNRIFQVSQGHISQENQ